MVAPAVNRSMPPIPLAGAKTRLLLVSDSADRLRVLKACLNHSEFEITTVSSFEELVIACHSRHDIVALDVSPNNIGPMLKLIRASASHTEVPVLVEATRLKNDFNLTGLLPRYRAMPCSYADMLTLVRRGGVRGQEERFQRGML